MKAAPHELPHISWAFFKLVFFEKPDSFLECVRNKIFCSVVYRQKKFISQEAYNIERIFAYFSNQRGNKQQNIGGGLELTLNWLPLLLNRLKKKQMTSAIEVNLFQEKILNKSEILQ